MDYKLERKKAKKKYKDTIESLKYWEKIEKKFIYNKNKGIENFEITFEHSQYFKGFIPDDEFKIGAIALSYGYEITNEELLSNKSIYAFKKK